jgi:glycosyltransferase involved in cell wall biosynthesis
MDFEWIVIDDGSADNTTQLFDEWVKAGNSFVITYVKKQNGGKHRAINDAVKTAKYDWFFIVDSDDFLTHDAVNLIHHWIETVELDYSFAAVAGLRGYINKDEVIGTRPDISIEYVDASSLEKGRFNLSGDKAEVWRTGILKKFPFPEYEGENFITEAVVWDEIALSGYKIRWFNEIIYKCEYMGDGLTNSGLKIFYDNFDGYTHYIRQLANRKSNNQDVILEYWHCAKTQKGLKLGRVADKLEISASKLLIILLKGWMIKLLKKSKAFCGAVKMLRRFLYKK